MAVRPPPSNFRLAKFFPRFVRVTMSDKRAVLCHWVYGKVGFIKVIIFKNRDTSLSGDVYCAHIHVSNY